jgi:integrase
LYEAHKCKHPFFYHWAFALFTGMRNGEMYSLRWSDIDEIRGIISISSQWTNKDGLHPTKTNTERAFPISKHLSKILTDLRKQGPFSENLKSLNGSSVFLNNLVLPRLTEWRHGEQARILRNFCKVIKIPEVKFHDLRATFITNAMDNGASLPKVMHMAGHSRIETTNKYLRLSGVGLDGASDKVSFKLPIGSHRENSNKLESR